MVPPFLGPLSPCGFPAWTGTRVQLGGQSKVSRLVRKWKWGINTVLLKQLRESFLFNLEFKAKLEYQCISFSTELVITRKDKHYYHIVCRQDYAAAVLASIALFVVTYVFSYDIFRGSIQTDDALTRLSTTLKR